MLFTDQAVVTEFEAELADVSRRINQLDYRRLFLLRKLELARVDRRDGARSMPEWASDRLDVSTGTASRLLTTAGALIRNPELAGRLQSGSMTFDRALATAQLAATDAPQEVVARSRDLDLSGVTRLTHRYRRVRSRDEQQAFANRYFAMQPTLDGSSWRGWFELPAVDGRIVDEAISQRADEFRRLPAGDSFDRNQRRADALVAMAADGLDRAHDDPTDSGGGGAVIFVDFDAANGSAGELGAEVAYGPRAGPDALREVLCTGSVQLIGMHKGKPVVTTGNTKSIPPAVRKFVTWRDGGCSIAGCHSRYRLQPHHIRHRAGGGDNDPDNLTLLCWFHHHVVIHCAGFGLQEDDPPGCRRLVRPRLDRGPPEV